jgi:methyl-accepting chemotaxis protein
MPSSIVDALSLVGTGGALIIVATVVSLFLGLGANLFLRGRYTSLGAELERRPDPRVHFTHPVLNRIVRDAREARALSPNVSTQAIVEDGFQSELGSLLLAERFVRSSTGLVIILGLLGTFYGLTSSIGQLIGLVAGDTEAATTDVGASITQGLSHSLSGMSVAFSNSLFGIFAAVVLTIVGIFSNVTDLRTAVMIRIENYVDKLLSHESAAHDGRANADARDVAVPGTDRLDRIVTSFGESVGRLESAVAGFDSALQRFAANTRDFGEFNLHLKDNVQRMSLSFGDFSETLKNEVGALKAGRRG